MLDVVASEDEELLEKYLEGGDLEPDEIRRVIRKGTINRDFVPVLCGSAFKNKGVQPLLDGIVHYLPSPADLPAVQGFRPGAETQLEERAPSDDEPFSALAFKIMSDPYVGKLTYFRVYSGKASKGDAVVNTTTGKRERFGRLLRMHASTQEDIDEVMTGDIVAAVGLKNTKTGDTLAASDQPIQLESMSFPDPVIAVAIEPKTKTDQDKLGEALSRLSEEDPTFRVHSDEETGQTIIEGMGELHLEIIVDRLLREFKVDANVGRPQVAYRETVKRHVRKIEGRLKRQTGGSGMFAHVVVDLEPTEAGSGFTFVDSVKGGNVPREFIPAVEKGMRDALDGGVLAGYPLVDLRATLVDGSSHSVDSNEMAFRIAGSMALQAAAKAAGVKLLEPIMEVEVVTPEDYMGEVIGDLSSRRGKIESMDSRGNMSGGEGADPAGRDVRLRNRRPVPYPGSGHLHHAVPLLPGGAHQHRRGDRRQVPRRVATPSLSPPQDGGSPSGGSGWRHGPDGRNRWLSRREGSLCGRRRPRARWVLPPEFAVGNGPPLHSVRPQAPRFARGPHRKRPFGRPVRSVRPRPNP